MSTHTDDPCGKRGAAPISPSESSVRQMEKWGDVEHRAASAGAFASNDHNVATKGRMQSLMRNIGGIGKR